ncbi:HU-CCDC81 and SPOR domain-containing protein [Micromonospora sp. HM5-17]|uniref:pPIWI_RE_Y domain-containing protein n=1 Tax=Micromonospora sp. HM5-17 TaxID=2487710 RepID=UPI000F484601|nr:HU-CCDC81 and SPOR domain-containing protein [Micromonospora sp. HM5-17]ROT31765.1 hypothetical protein EF879_15385 [Micromonospora sp. HM5-17]
MHATAGEIDLQHHDGVALLRVVATALIVLAEQTAPDSPVYPDKVQKAFNALVLQCLRRGVSPPVSVPEMARWAATKPLAQWPVDLPNGLVGDDDLLVDGALGRPTQLAYSWQVFAADAAAELFENKIMHEAFQRCRAAQAPEAYTAFRRLLIQRPVLTASEKALLLGDDPTLSPVTHVIDECYEEAPAAYLDTDGTYATCARCGCLLKPYGDGWLCALDRCRRDGTPSVDRRLSARKVGGVYHLKAPLRMSVTGPGLAEIDLERSLTSIGIAVQMWPEYDAYDLRVSLPNGQVWAVDVKDHKQPAMLGVNVRPFRSSPRYDKAFLVVPKYRFEDREDYARVFNHWCPDEVKRHVTLLTDQAFVRRVKKEIKAHAVTPAVGGKRA